MLSNILSYSYEIEIKEVYLAYIIFLQSSFLFLDCQNFVYSVKNSRVREKLHLETLRTLTIGNSD